MQSTNLIDIFEDNYNIVRNRFETDSVNVIKKDRLFQTSKEKISIYIN